MLELAVPSMQTNVLPSQCEIPPLLPLQGVFCEKATEGIKSALTIASMQAGMNFTSGLVVNRSSVVNHGAMRFATKNFC